MSDKRFPARMHEILTKPGEPPLKSGEMFALNPDPDDMDYYLTDYGDMFLRYGTANKTVRMANADEVLDAINHGITRRPRLTDEQVRHLKGLYLLGFRWIERDEHDALVAWENYDDKADVFQNDFLPLSYRSHQVLIVVLTRNAPLNIVQTLRDAGVEVEE